MKIRHPMSCLRHPIQSCRRPCPSIFRHHFGAYSQKESCKDKEMLNCSPLSDFRLSCICLHCHTYKSLLLLFSLFLFSFLQSLRHSKQRRSSRAAITACDSDSLLSRTCLYCHTYKTPFLFFLFFQCLDHSEGSRPSRAAIIACYNHFLLSYICLFCHTFKSLFLFLYFFSARFC